MSHIQSIIFKKDKYSLLNALKWLHEHEYKDNFARKGVDEKDDTWRFRQKHPNENKYVYRFKKINDGIGFIIGYPK
jgi:hypothetical protein